MLVDTLTTKLCFHFALALLRGNIAMCLLEQDISSYLLLCLLGCLHHRLQCSVDTCASLGNGSSLETVTRCTAQINLPCEQTALFAYHVPVTDAVDWNAKKSCFFTFNDSFSFMHLF